MSAVATADRVIARDPELSERDYELINRLMPVVVAGWRAADDLTLAHEAERLDGLPTSPVIVSMRAFVEAEQALRTGREVSRD